MKPRDILIWLFFFAVLFIISRFNYLLFHSIAEFASIFIAAGIFMVAWNTRRINRNDYFLFLGIAYLFIAFIDTLHTLSYEGINVIGHGANMATQYWISARFVEAVSFMVAPLLLKRRPDFRLVWVGFTAVFAIIVTTITIGIFPTAFDNGLTVFKIATEYIICAILLIALYLLWKNRLRFSRYIYRLLAASIVFTVLGELSFTLYTDPFGLFNLIGHFFKLTSFAMIYQAVIVTNLREPYTAMFRDIKMKEKKLEEANETKVEFMNITAHELRNPLTSIVGYSKMLLKKGKLGATERKHIEVISEESWRMKHLVDDFLDIVKLESRKMRFEMKETDMEKVLETSYLQMKTEAGNLKFTKSVSAGLPRVRVDSGRIIQVLCNLMINAFKFTEEGSVRISASEKEGGVLVQVKDTGIGIKKEDMDKLFVKFSQLDTKYRRLGTGLGLAISREIIEAHKGYIRLESSSKGSTFSFWLPGINN